MSQTAVTLLIKQADLHRRHADRARRLACSFSTPDVIERLEQFARELDGKAGELEARARQLRGSIGRTCGLAAAVRLIAESRRGFEIAVPANDNAD